MSHVAEFSVYTAHYVSKALKLVEVAHSAVIVEAKAAAEVRLLFEASLFEYGVGRVPRLDRAIDGNVPAGFGAMPNFVITL
jgi:hypothetical protein